MSLKLGEEPDCVHASPNVHSFTGSPPYPCSLADDDLITIFDSSDLSFAIQCSRILKLTLFGKLFGEL